MILLKNNQILLKFVKKLDTGHTWGYNDNGLVYFIEILHIFKEIFMKELFTKIFKKIKDEIFTIPNMLSILRLLLIPVIVYFYVFKHDNLWTLILVAFSSLTDIVDGFIARRFNMITDFGKFIDPVADKATQITIIACLVTRFRSMIIPCIVLVIKELSSLVLRFIVFKETEVVDGAKWHGKLATVLVVSTVGVHLIWYDMGEVISTAIIAVCTLFMLFSWVLYTVDGLKLLKKNEK